MPSFPPDDRLTGFRTVVRKRRVVPPGQASTLTPSTTTLTLGAHSRGGGKRLVPTERSHNRSAHGHQAGAGAKLHRLDESSSAAKHAKVSPAFAGAMQRERLARKWTQKQLAQQIHEKVQVVHQYESGQAIPNGAIIQKLNKVLGGNLPTARRHK